MAIYANDGYRFLDYKGRIFRGACGELEHVITIAGYRINIDGEK